MTVGHQQQARPVNRRAGEPVGLCVGRPVGRWVNRVVWRLSTHEAGFDQLTGSPTNRRAGFTLVEVLLASLILGVGLTVLLSCLSTCLRTMALVRDYEQVNWTFGLGELAYPDPFDPSLDVKKDYTVDPDSSLVDGFTFERTVDDKLDEDLKKDPLYIVRTRVTWGEGGDGGEKPHEEIVRYVWQRSK